MKSHVRFTLLGLLLIMAAGCTTTTAPRLPPGEPEEPDPDPIGTAFVQPFAPEMNA